MEPIIQGYEPQSMFTYFEQISAIPRGSGDEGRIADFLCAFAAEHGIACVKDEANNVFMTKPATPGYEDRDAILLQGHTDMVCEKVNGSSHDFTTDPIKLILKDGILTADGTTLGGDNGLAVVMMMAILTEDISHPKLECLFTSDEERGMTGAKSFDYSKITATKLINLDSEEEGVATVSCAGGARVRMELPYIPVPIPKTDGLLSVSIGGLSGGHSGGDIHLGKGNANELLARLLLTAYEAHPFQLISIQGGSKENAITRDASALIYTGAPAAFRAVASEMEKTFRAEAIKSDRGLRIHVRKQSDSEDMRAMSFVDTTKVLDVITLAPTGPLSYSPADRSLVESSSNLGVVVTESDRVVLTYLARSSSETKMDHLILRYSRLAKRVSARISIHDRYPGWEYQAVSPLRDQFLRIAEEELGRSHASAIHAGLECGFILSAVKHPLDAISIGPNMHDIHSPDESMELASCERMWKVVLRLLAE